MRRLWINDYASIFSTRERRVVAYNVDSGERVFTHTFPREVAGFGSMLNDLVYDKRRNQAYLSNPAPGLFAEPSLLVIDVATNTSRRVLSGHASVKATANSIVVEGKPFTVLGFDVKLAVDGLALDRTLDWLYYSPANSGALYRVPLDALADPGLADKELEARVETVASNVPMSDGMEMDANNRIHFTDIEHSAIVRREPNGVLTTLVKDARFRWPTNISFGPEGDLYFTINAVNEVTFKPDREVLAKGPNQLFKIPASELPP